MMCKELTFNEHGHFILYCEVCPKNKQCCEESFNEFKSYGKL